jgi:hypothetical protein
MTYRSSVLYRSGKYRPGVYELLYRNTFNYRTNIGYRNLFSNADNYDLTYRNSANYRSTLSYRTTSVPTPLFDTITVVDSETLTVSLVLTDQLSASEVEVPSILVVALTSDSQQFFDSMTLVLDQADTGSGAETEAQGNSLTDSDTVRYSYGSEQAYRFSNDYRNDNRYRGGGSFINIDVGTQSDTAAATDVTLSFTNAVTVTEALSILEAHGIDLSNADTSSVVDNLVDLILLSDDVAEGTDLDIGGDRTTIAPGDSFSISEDMANLFGDRATNLSYITVNRYRKTPSRFKFK